MQATRSRISAIDFARAQGKATLVEHAMSAVHSGPPNIEWVVGKIARGETNVILYIHDKVTGRVWQIPFPLWLSPSAVAHEMAVIAADVSRAREAWVRSGAR